MDLRNFTCLKGEKRGFYIYHEVWFIDLILLCK
jgi:hypothetical protein